MLFHFKTRKIPMKKTTPHIKIKKAIKYSRNSDNDDAKESLNVSKTADTVTPITEPNQV